MFSLKGKKAIVTGASKGLGKAMAIGLAEAGADVAVISSSEKIYDIAVEISELGVQGMGVEADLTSIKPINEVVQNIVDTFGQIDILINCAGIIKRAPALEFTEEDWDDVIAVNQKSLFFMCQRVAKEMKKTGGGKIINIASILSFQGGILVPSYTASKSAVAGLTKALANEWAEYSINVNAIAPGYMATEMTEALQKNDERASAILSRIPQGRWGTPDDMKGTAVFLASKASNYINGHILVVDGGWMGR